jgi:hypothetical protein
MFDDEFEYDYFEPEDLNDLLAEGEGKFRITQVAPKLSSKGNPMLVINFDVMDANGKTGYCTEFLVRGNDESQKKRLATKIRNLANSVNKPHLYEKGYKLKPNDLLGEMGNCMIKTQQGDERFPSKSIISKYIDATIKDAADNIPDDDINF